MMDQPWKPRLELEPVVEILPAPERPPQEDRQPGGKRRRPATRKAVALEYKRGRQRAPVISASGRGEVAERIIALAEAAGIYIQPDPDLVEILAQLDLGSAIPPKLYYVIAEILAFVYRLNERAAAEAAR